MSSATSRSRSGANFRTVRAGEPDPKSGQPLKIARAIEVGHVFLLGTKYPRSYGAVYTDDQKQSHLMVMGCYGIGISRTLQAVVEQSNDADGINLALGGSRPGRCWWSTSTPQDAAATELCKKLAGYAEQAGAGRPGRRPGGTAGVKFKDADLIGLPLRLTVADAASRKESLK